MVGVKKEVLEQVLLATHQIVGMGEAFKLAKEKMSEDFKNLSKYRDILWNGLKDMEEVYINGAIDNTNSRHI